MYIRGRTYIFIFICLVMAFGVYFFENKVHEVSEQIEITQETLSRNDEDLRVLEAEWSYLNNPERISSIAEKIHDNMNSPTKSQFTSLESLPVREVMYSNAQSQIMP